MKYRALLPQDKAQYLAFKTNLGDAPESSENEFKTYFSPSKRVYAIWEDDMSSILGYVYAEVSDDCTLIYDIQTLKGEDRKSLAKIFITKLMMVEGDRSKEKNSPFSLICSLHQDKKADLSVFEEFQFQKTGVDMDYDLIEASNPLFGPEALDFLENSMAEIPEPEGDAPELDPELKSQPPSEPDEDFNLIRSEFQALLDTLEDLSNKLNEHNKYKRLATVTQTLKKNLRENFLVFKNVKTPEALEQFKKEAKEEMKRAEKEFKKDCELWKQIPPIFKRILGVLSALTIIPAIIVAATAKRGYVDTFFKESPNNPLSRLHENAQEEQEIEEKMNAKFGKH
jgi:hypothetical protein